MRCVYLNAPRSKRRRIHCSLLTLSPNFEAARNAHNPASLDWSSDNCSDSPDNPLGFNFKPPCHRHDFGYRNYEKQGTFTATAKNEVDENFKHDMYNVCNKESLLKRLACKGVTDIYFAAVQEFGSKKRAIQAANERLGDRAVLRVEVFVYGTSLPAYGLKIFHGLRLVA